MLAYSNGGRYLRAILLCGLMLGVISLFSYRRRLYVLKHTQSPLRRLNGVAINLESLHTRFGPNTSYAAVEEKTIQKNLYKIICNNSVVGSGSPTFSHGHAGTVDEAYRACRSKLRKYFSFAEDGTYRCSDEKYCWQHYKYKGTVYEMMRNRFTDKSHNGCQLKTNPRVLVYNRIAKAGSSSLLNLIHKLSKVNNFSVFTSFQYDNRTVAERIIDNALSKKSNERSIIVEHFHFISKYTFDDRVAFFNLARNPLDRQISYYCYSRWGNRPRDARAQIINRWGNNTFSECFYMELKRRKKVCMNEDHFQKNYICGDEVHAMLPEDIFHCAHKNLRSHYFIGIAEEYRTTLKMLSLLYPTFFNGVLEIYNNMTQDEQLRNRSPEDTAYKVCKPNATTNIQKLMLATDERFAVEWRFYQMVVKQFYDCVAKVVQ